jgi:hypothetical protein
MMLLASNLGMSGDYRLVSMSICRQLFEGGLLKNVGLYSYSIPKKFSVIFGGLYKRKIRSKVLLRKIYSRTLFGFTCLNRLSIMYINTYYGVAPFKTPLLL